MELDGFASHFTGLPSAVCEGEAKIARTPRGVAKIFGRGISYRLYCEATYRLPTLSVYSLCLKEREV